MNLKQIKQAIADGQIVHWGNDGYRVIKDSIDQYMIQCTSNNHCIGLTWLDGTTLNGKESEFYIAIPARSDYLLGLTFDQAEQCRVNGLISESEFEWYRLEWLKTPRFSKVGQQ